MSGDLHTCADFPDFLETLKKAGFGAMEVSLLTCFLCQSMGESYSWSHAKLARGQINMRQQYCQQGNGVVQADIVGHCNHHR
jgi:hypothetical protein